MNKTAEAAVKSELGVVEDNLYRFRNFGTPDQLTGNGETFASVIASLEKKRAELLAALEES